MSARTQGISADRRGLLRWAAGLGAVTSEALAAREREARPASARGRLAAARRAGLMEEWRLLRGRPALYTVTRAGLRAAGVRGVAPARVSAAVAAHATECCAAAVALEAAYGEDYEVLGEPAIRATGLGLASAPGGRSHRPDLLLLPRRVNELPIAVEIELTVKSPRRLETICRCWARERSVAGVIYVSPPDVQARLRVAIEQSGAGDRIAVLGVEGRSAIEVVR
jgi:hypothetical protein